MLLIVQKSATEGGRERGRVCGCLGGGGGGGGGGGVGVLGGGGGLVCVR